MKKTLSILLVLAATVCFTGCYDICGHETYTDVSDYNKIFDLTEIRFTTGFEIFPDDVSVLDVEDFYCEWELGIVGSADVEIHLAVSYDEGEFDEEVTRLQTLGNGEIVYDTEHFSYPAYAAVLGYYSTSWYALVDEDSLTVHYILLQLTDPARVDIDKEFMPKGYYGFGDVNGAGYNIYDIEYNVTSEQ